MFGRIALVGNISSYNADITAPRQGIFALHKAKKVQIFHFSMIAAYFIGGSMGAPGTHPLDQNFFIPMQFSRRIYKVVGWRPLGVCRTLWEILDLPMYLVIMNPHFLVC